MIRSFTANDIEPVSRLHRRVFAEKDDFPDDVAKKYDAYFRGLFLESPWTDPELPSLVFTKSDEIIGFLGVVPLDVRFDGQVVRASRSTQLIVHPDSRSGLAGVQLLKHYLGGAQDISIADEATAGTRRIWERLDGHTVMLDSLRWIRPLRPAKAVVSKVGQRSSLALAAAAARPFAWGADTMARSLGGSPYKPPETKGRLTTLTSRQVVETMGATCVGARLNPVYTQDSFDWIIEHAGIPNPSGGVESGAVMEDEKVIGWFVYCPFEDGYAGEVLQLTSLPGKEDQVLQHLIKHADERDFVELRGRVNNRFAEVLTDAQAMFYRRGSWMLVHSSRSELLEPLFRGDHSLSRLDGEWVLRFS